ncbi:MAG: hypothetical protein JW860_04230 [Sedimentisphaerales bacterium]|nr:hypothetical protein [Sedimentisphaerales bacterium]
MTVNYESDYDKIITALFNKKYNANRANKEINFTKDELVETAKEIGVQLRNPPDVVYTYRSRRLLPDDILKAGNWILKPKGKGRFSFMKTKRESFVNIQEGLYQIETLNALPEIVEKHVSSDEQGLLSLVRYNRLIDIFTGITCFHLQSHVRTTIAEEGQIEIDELYVGLDEDGKEYILPTEAKGFEDRDKLGWFQVANLVKFSRQYFPELKCKPIAIKPGGKDVICMMEFDDNDDFEKKFKEHQIIQAFSRNEIIIFLMA